MTDQSNASTSTPEAAKEFSVQDVKQTLISQNDLPNSTELLGNLISWGEANKKGLVFNFDMNANNSLPEGFSVLVQPIAERSTGSEGNITKQVVIAAVPSLDLVMADEKGRALVADILATHFGNKLKTALRAQEAGTGTGTLPSSYADFIESRRGGSDMKAFNDLAGDFVAALRKKGLKIMSKPLLRSVLANKNAALEHFKKIEDNGGWVAVLNSMIKTAQDRKLDPVILVHWLNTRNDNTNTFEDDIDLGDIATLLVDPTAAQAPAVAPVQEVVE